MRMKRRAHGSGPGRGKTFKASAGAFGMAAWSALLVVFVLAVVPAAWAADPWTPLKDRLEEDGFDRKGLDALFGLPGVEFDHDAMVDKMETLFQTKFGSALVRRAQARLVELGYNCGAPDGKAGPDTRWAVRSFQLVAGLPVDGRIDEELLSFLERSTAMAPEGFREPAASADTGPSVYKSVMTSTRLAESVAFFLENTDRLALLESTYGVPPEIAVGLLSVETRVGKYLGEDHVFVTLASMAMCEDFSLLIPGLRESGFFQRENPSADQLEWLVRRTGEKAEWAYLELKGLLTHAMENGHDVTSIVGSIYGAIGICQFMPSNAVKFGRDGNGDGVVDLFDPDDAIMSLGNYLKEHGWEADMSEERQRKVLYRYNHSRTYVNTILAVAEHIRSRAGE